jgi:predicted RND superfamily exporter protein
VTILAGVGASQLSTEFSQRDFIPEGSHAQIVLDRTETLFGGDLTEQTFVFIEGDLSDPAVANAVLDAQRAIDEQVDAGLVRRSSTGAQIQSGPGLVAQIAAVTAGAPDGSEPGTPGAETAPDPQQLQLALSAGGWTERGFAPDADLPALYDLVDQTAPGQLDQLLADDREAGLMTIASSAGQDDADELADQLQPALDPLREAGATVTVVSEPLVIDEILDAMAASQTRSIITTLLAALLLLVGYYGIAHRRPLLGAVTMVPSTLSVAWVLGAMYLLGLSFNVLTSTIAALAIGIGVPYGIHITHRFVEDRRRASQVDEAMRATIMHTGGALAGSAATTAIGFGVLVLSDLAPIQQFGGVSALTIIFALAGSVLVQPSLLVLWDRADRRRHPTATADPASTATPTGTGGR